VFSRGRFGSPRVDLVTFGPEAALENAAVSRTEAAPVFLPVRVVDPEADVPRAAPPIKIVLPERSIVRVPCGFDLRTLGDALAVLEDRPC
jgi:hypothetical protein